MNLTEISTCLLETESHAESLQAVAELYALFLGIVALSDNPASFDQADTYLSEGKALSPGAAARCILDYMRTRSFLRGVRAAVVEAQRRFPGQTIQILYAGCGPFAPLVLPLTTQFTSDQVQVTLIDIHKRSLDSVRRIVETLGLSGYVQGYLQCDAATYQKGFESAPHIILIETMQKALEKEPQVAVTRNLIRLLRKDGILIPERIRINACLADLSKEVAAMKLDDSGLTEGESCRRRIDLGVVFELTAESAQHPWPECQDKLSGANLCSTAVSMCVPDIAIDGPHLMILTDITVFDSVVLRDYESGITYPTILFDLDNMRSNDQLEFRYVTGATPGLRYRRV